jgi:hypothetical protein
MSNESHKNSEKNRLAGRIFLGLIIVFLLVVIGASLYLGLGGLTPMENNATATVYIETSNALKQFYFLTQTAAPTRTPMPTLKPDTRSPFEKCVQSGFGIRYVISGTGVSAVSLTFENDTGGTDQGDYQVPFCHPFFHFQSGDFLYISAQIISGDGNIKCQILDGNTLIAEANASGFPSIATCSGSAR